MLDRIACGRSTTVAGLAAAVSTLALLTSPALAQSVWQGATSNWGTASNWSTNAVPGSGTTAVIGSGGAVSPLVAGGSAAVNVVKIGASGAGASLGVSSGGTFTYYSATIGELAGQIGSVAVSGAGTTWTGPYLYSGYQGSGSFTLSDGAAANLNFAQSGVFAGSSGAVTITGAGTTWSTSGGHIVGDSGQGVLQILNGGYANDRAATVGDKVTSNGTATVSGAGSLWNVQLVLMVGAYGTGHLGIGNGGDVQAGSYIAIGRQSGSVGSLSVDGAGSSLSTTSYTVVGWNGTGSAVVSNGGQVNTQQGMIGYFAPGSGTLRVTGAGSQWIGTTYLLVGYGGNGTLTVDSGGLVRISDGAGRIFIANQAGSTGTVNIGAASGATAQAAGILDVSELRFGAGTGRIVFNHTESSYALNAAITGAGTVLVENGTTVLGGANTYSGATRIRSGTLELATATAAGTSTIELGGGSGTPTLRFGGSYTVANAMTMAAGGGTIDTGGHAVVLSGALGGTDGFTKSGSGSLTLTGTGSYAGATTVNAGLLAVNGAIGGSGVTVNAGGTLGGTGTINAATTISGGTLQAGNLAINGGLSLTASSVYVFTPASLTTVNGAAALGGSTLAFTPTSFQAQTYTVLTATGGVSGTFTVAGAGGSTASVTYGVNDVTLTVDGYRATPALLGTPNGNVGAVAGGIDRFLNSGGTPPAAFNSLLGLSGPALAATLGNLSGEAGTGAVTAGISTTSTFLSIMLDPMAGARRAMANGAGSSLIEMADIAARATPAARVETGWNIWTKAFGQTGRSASDAGTGATGGATGLYGVAAGADRMISSDMLAGFALAGGGTNFGLGPLGQGTGDFLQIGLYGSMRLGAGYLSAALAYGWNRFDVSRNAGLGGLLETYRSSPVAHTFGGRTEIGRRFGQPVLGVTPYAAIEAIGYGAQAYSETWVVPATGAFALNYAGRVSATLRAEAGLRVDSQIRMGEAGTLLAFGRLAYGWQSNPQRAADAQFQQLANSGFTVFGARASMHTALMTLGVETRLRDGMKASLALDGEVGDRHRAVRASMGLGKVW